MLYPLCVQSMLPQETKTNYAHRCVRAKRARCKRKAYMCSRSITLSIHTLEHVSASPCAVSHEAVVRALIERARSALRDGKATEYTISGVEGMSVILTRRDAGAFTTAPTHSAHDVVSRMPAPERTHRTAPHPPTPYVAACIVAVNATDPFATRPRFLEVTVDLDGTIGATSHRGSLHSVDLIPPGCGCCLHVLNQRSPEGYNMVHRSNMRATYGLPEVPEDAGAGGGAGGAAAGFAALRRLARVVERSATSDAGQYADGLRAWWLNSVQDAERASMHFPPVREHRGDDDAPPDGRMLSVCIPLM